jgi:predicted nucleic acid-binding protein
MNLVDSSGWLEYFADGPNADFFAPAVEDLDDLVVPTISLYEVFKVVLRQQGESKAIRAIGVMQQGSVVDLDAELALNAAKASLDYDLPMADSVILATARKLEAALWTQDSDFEGLDDVHYVAKG